MLLQSSSPPQVPTKSLISPLKFTPKSSKLPQFAPQIPLHLRSRPSLRCRASNQSLPNAAATLEQQQDPSAKPKMSSFDGLGTEGGDAKMNVSVGTPSFLPFGLGAYYRMSLGDQAFFLMAFIACTTTVAFTGLVIAAVPTLLAMKRAALSLARLADVAREELPSTMAAIRLSGMEISDLTLELSDLSQEIADGVSKSTQAVQAAEAGIRQIGSLARHQTASMIEERANLPNISLTPVVVGAARKTSHVVDQAKKTLLNFISRGNDNSDNEDVTDKVEI